jgi:co-chaperonin GroES (HSP10)
MATRQVRCKAHELRPLGSRILVRPDRAPEKHGLIIIPPTAQEKHHERQRVHFATVVAIGPGMKTAVGGRWPMPAIKPGDRVLFTHEGGYGLLLEDDDGNEVLYVMTRDSFIVAVFEDDESAMPVERFDLGERAEAV